jgi:hypothetical protein
MSENVNQCLLFLGKFALKNFADCCTRMAVPITGELARYEPGGALAD